MGAGLVLFLSIGCQKSIARPTLQPTRPVSTTIVGDNASSGKPKQFVVMAFDGSRSLPMWQKTLDFSQAMNASGTPVRFTYFLSGVYFLNYRKASRYTPPHGPAGYSAIGFADSNNDIERRISYVNRAIEEGHEIGSHANGHFDGSTWSKADWQQELDSFRDLVFNAAKNNDVSVEDADRFAVHLDQSQLIGFRAPELGHNNSMFETLVKEGYAYDTSLGNLKPDTWPKKNSNGLWEFPLAKIPYANTASTLLSMDYNFYFKQSNAKEVAKKGDATWNAFYQDTYNSYVNYFESNYQGSRAPVFIGSHFSEWNDGVYWQAMQDFATHVCGKPEVVCGTFSDLKKYMEQRPELSTP
jgi:hypothetical protein